MKTPEPTAPMLPIKSFSFIAKKNPWLDRSQFLLPCCDSQSLHLTMSDNDHLHQYISLSLALGDLEEDISTDCSPQLTSRSRQFSFRNSKKQIEKFVRRHSIRTGQYGKYLNQANTTMGYLTKPPKSFDFTRKCPIL